MVNDEFRELNKETSETLVERERKKKEKRSTRKKRVRGRDSAREQKGTVPCDGVLAEERRRRLYCAGPIPTNTTPPPRPLPILILGFWKITT